MYLSFAVFFLGKVNVEEALRRVSEVVCTTLSCLCMSGNSGLRQITWTLWLDLHKEPMKGTIVRNN